MKHVVECKWCGAMILDRNMPTHLDSLGCKWKSRGAKLRDAGYVRFEHSSEVGRLAGLYEIPESKLVATQYSAYVPRWIADAHKMFTLNKGYGGMKFIDFLNKMRPDTESED